MSALSKKIVLITGATSGIGKACAESFAKKGCNLILIARRKERIFAIAKELEKRYDIKTKAIILDVRNYQNVKKAFNSLPADWKKINYLINNAGLAKGFNKIYEGEISHWEEMIDTNIKGLLYVTRQILPLMIANGKGHVINIGSTAGHEVYPSGNVYCATKYAVNALTQSIRIDVLDKNIKVSTVDPGMVETEFSLVRFSGDKEKAKSIYKGISPLHASDVANAVLFCALQPAHVNINEIIITPAAQASSTQIYRK